MTHTSRGSERSIQWFHQCLLLLFEVTVFILVLDIIQAMGLRNLADDLGLNAATRRNNIFKAMRTNPTTKYSTKYCNCKQIRCRNFCEYIGMSLQQKRFYTDLLRSSSVSRNCRTDFLLKLTCFGGF